MNKWSMFRAVLLVFPLMALAAEPENGESVVVSWSLGVDAEGHIVSLVSRGQPDDAIREPLEAIVRGWEFEPGRIDGQPVASETSLSVLAARVPAREGGGYAVEVRDVRLGGAMADEPARRGQARHVLKNASKELGAATALVVTRVEYDAAGKVVGSEVVSTHPRVSRAFARDLENMFKRSTYAPEKLAGKGVAGGILVPFCHFSGFGKEELDRRGAACDAQPWNVPDMDQELRGQMSVPLDPKVRLKSNPFAATP